MHMHVKPERLPNRWELESLADWLWEASQA